MHPPTLPDHSLSTSPGPPFSLELHPHFSSLQQSLLKKLSRKHCCLPCSPHWGWLLASPSPETASSVWPNSLSSLLLSDFSASTQGIALFLQSLLLDFHDSTLAKCPSCPIGCFSVSLAVSSSAQPLTSKWWDAPRRCTQISFYTPSLHDGDWSAYQGLPNLISRSSISLEFQTPSHCLLLYF